MTQAQKRNMCMMEDIIKYCCQHDIFIDITFYVNGHKYSSEKGPTAKAIQTGPYEYYDYGEADVTTIVEYNNPDTLTMTFEGPLYDDINYGDGSAEEAIRKIADKYGLYPEQGFAWSLAIYK